MTYTELIALWGLIGIASGGAFGAVTRSLLSSRSFGWRAWTTSAALTGGTFVLLAWRIDQPHLVPPLSYLAAILVALAAVDLAEHRLPSAIILPSYPILGAGLTAVAILDSRYANLAMSLTGMVTLAAAYLTLALTTSGLGAGDVKLAGLLGLTLGWYGWTTILTGTLLGWLLAATARFTLRATRHIDRTAPTPLGPHLGIGAIVALIVLNTS